MHNAHACTIEELKRQPVESYSDTDSHSKSPGYKYGINGSREVGKIEIIKSRLIRKNLDSAFQMPNFNADSNKKFARNNDSSCQKTCHDCQEKSDFSSS